jgi:hypothetical protein
MPSSARHDLRLAKRPEPPGAPAFAVVEEVVLPELALVELPQAIKKSAASSAREQRPQRANLRGTVEDGLVWGVIGSPSWMDQPPEPNRVLVPEGAAAELLAPLGLTVMLVAVTAAPFLVPWTTTVSPGWTCLALVVTDFVTFAAEALILTVFPCVLAT